ncbi:LPP20 family lipoprotein [Labilibaculum sp.]|uniref:LPP20 family lipoprotein n=1 Tax=Labilibaculum sp. TaxID=2060723 RepID=UPI002AA8BB65|nr:LPP20 family lipoprotein [Labilibaculum sp.]MBN2597352.1 LPP20 family lipoprotein [Marinifilaceae bacterium]
MIKSLRTLLHFSFILTFIVSCSSNTTAAKRRPPQWVKERPVSSEYYIGIAVVKKDANETSYIQLAKNQALQDLCSEISISISSNSVLHQFENNTSFKEEFEADIKTSLVQDLEGYEMVASWDNKKEGEYWVYYQLSKNQYALLKRVKLNKAKKLSQSYFEEGKQYEKQLDLFQALNYYAKSLDAIKNHLDEDLSVMTLDGTINLGTDIYNSIQNIFNRTQLTPVKKTIQLEISTSQKEPILVKAVWLADEGEKMISQLPLEIKFTKGAGILNGNVSTDQFGYASSQLSRVSSRQKLQEITASLDLSSILDESNENYELNKLFFTEESAPKSKITLNVERLKAYLNFSEKIFGEDSKRGILENNLKKELSENFFSFTNNKDQAKVILDINTNVTKGEIKEGRNYKVYIVYLDCFFSLTDVKTGLEIFNDAIYEVKGMKPISYDYAVKEAYEQAVDEINNTIVPKLNQLDL